jgi:tetratricopeptide (TPR) repeat protein
MSRSLLACVGFCALVSAASADDALLDQPLFARPDAVITLDAKTTATALETTPPCFARQVKGTKLEVKTARGWGWVERKQMMTLEEATKYCEQHKKEPYALYLHSITQEDSAKSLADLSAAIKLDPRFVRGICERGNLYAQMGDFDKAQADLVAAVKVAPKDLLAMNDLAWFRATCPEAKFRDGKSAVADATRVCEATSYKNEEFLDTLAAAYAEAGDFKSAAKWAAKALEIDPENEGLAAHLKLFQSKQPLRDDGK